ncbi:hypothetical protein VNO80_17514 [Phaseolus coccineus]|uniref:Pentatricopeptide repeat-containing protein n=1 Tax=Phaseolus coccineus TaxID=3886 RepID=A0AAN9QXZ8_PHACN
MGGHATPTNPSPSYAECPQPHDSFAWALFDTMPHRDVVLVSSTSIFIIHGLVNDDRPVQHVTLFHPVLESGIEEWGIGVHSLSNVATTLVDMYAKGGGIQRARKVFDDVVAKDVFVWTAMISGLACHGLSKEAVHMIFVESSVVKPDEKTVPAVLTTRRNAGLTREGYVFFNE